jgi:hypothetical protein
MRSIHIYENGPVVTAILKDGKQTVSKGVAKCNPKDKYWFDIGAQIALDRALCKTTYQTLCMLLDKENKPDKPNPSRIVKQDRYEVGGRVKFVDGAPLKNGTISDYETWANGRHYLIKEDALDCYWNPSAIEGKLVPAVREVHSRAKAGERIKLINQVYSFNQAGDILRVDGQYGNELVYVCGINHPRKTDDTNEQWVYATDEYVVLENYQPPQVREVKRPAKVGEWVKVTGAYCTFGDYQNGDVFKVGARYMGSSIRPKGHEVDWTYISDSEYVVLENYEPEVRRD